MVLVKGGGTGGAGECSWVEKLNDKTRRVLKEVAYSYAMRRALEAGDYVRALALARRAVVEGYGWARELENVLSHYATLRGIYDQLRRAASLIDEGRYREAVEVLDAVLRVLDSMRPWPRGLRAAAEEARRAAIRLHELAAVLDAAAEWGRQVRRHIVAFAAALRDREASVFERISRAASAWEQLAADLEELRRLASRGGLEGEVFGRLASELERYMRDVYSEVAGREPLLAQRMKEAAARHGLELPPPGAGMSGLEKLGAAVGALAELLEGLAQYVEERAEGLSPLLRPAAWLASGAAWLAASLLGAPLAAARNVEAVVEAVRERSLTPLERSVREQLEELVPRTPGQAAALVLGALLAPGLRGTLVGRAVEALYDAAAPVAAALGRAPRLVAKLRSLPGTRYVEVLEAAERYLVHEFGPLRGRLELLSEELRRLGAEEAARRVREIAENIERYGGDTAALEELAGWLERRLAGLEKASLLPRVEEATLRSLMERLGVVSGEALAGERLVLLRLEELLRRALRGDVSARAELLSELRRLQPRGGLVSRVLELVSEGRLGEAYRLVAERLEEEGYKPRQSLLAVSAPAVETREAAEARAPVPPGVAKALGLEEPYITLRDLPGVLERLSAVKLSPGDAAALARAVARLLEEARERGLRGVPGSAVLLERGAVAAELVELARALPEEQRGLVYEAALRLLAGDQRGAVELLSRLPAGELRGLASGAAGAVARLLAEAEEEARRLIEERGRPVAGRVVTREGTVVKASRPLAETIAELERLANRVEEVELPGGLRLTREVVVGPSGEVVYRVEVVDREGRWVRYVYRASPAGPGRYVVQERLYADPALEAAEEASMLRGLAGWLRGDPVVEILERIRPVYAASRLPRLAEAIEAAAGGVKALSSLRLRPGAALVSENGYRIVFTDKLRLDLPEVKVRIDGATVTGFLDETSGTVYIPYVKVRGSAGAAGEAGPSGETGLKERRTAEAAGAEAGRTSIEAGTEQGTGQAAGGGGGGGGSGEAGGGEESWLRGGYGEPRLVVLVQRERVGREERERGLQEALVY